MAEDELLGTWVFKDTLLLGDDFTYGINFACNNLSYIGISFNSGREYLYYRSSDDFAYEGCYDWSMEMWDAEYYRTITITDTSSLTNRDAFVTWLKANAVKQAGTTSYPVTVNVTNGTIADAPTAVEQGGRIHIVVKPNAGYELLNSGVSVTGATLDSLSENTTQGNYDLQFSNPTGDVTIDLTLTVKAPTGTTITYNGKTIATLSEGQTATMACAGKKAVTDIVVAFTSAGTVTYNGKETAVATGKTATLVCGGKKMVTDVVVKVGGSAPAEDELLGTWVFNETLVRTSSDDSLYAEGVCFTCAGIAYEIFNVYYPSFEEEGVSGVEFARSDGEEIMVYALLADELVEVIYGYGWTDPKYRTITITDTSDLTFRDEFTTWLKANATKQ